MKTIKGTLAILLTARLVASAESSRRLGRITDSLAGASTHLDARSIRKRAHFMSATGKTVRSQALASSTTLTAPSTRGNGGLVSAMDKAHFTTQMAASILARGNKIKNMAKAKLFPPKA